MVVPLSLRHRSVHYLLFFILSIASASSSSTSSTVGSSVVHSSTIHRDATDPWIEPYPYLNGGQYNGTTNQSPFNPDPLQTYVWNNDVNASILQIYYLLPTVITLMPNTPSTSFVNYESLYQYGGNMTVQGYGALQFDFGQENAAWLEFDSYDLDSTNDGMITMGVSEYNEYGIFNVGPKVGVPKAYSINSTVTTYRLELNPDLYEGVRFGWIYVNATPATPFHVTNVRVVCQIKPTNWMGSVAIGNDDLLTRIWYNGAYTVKLNLLSNQIGAILMYRGDRFSWTGDAHVAQKTSMAAFHNYDFVLQNILFTQNNCNGIESYCLYLVLSVVDYFDATGDTASIIALNATAVNPKLEHAYAIWNTRANLGFISWDDRGGSGFNNATTLEAEYVYKFLAIRAWTQWARVLRIIGDTVTAEHYETYVNTTVNIIYTTGGSDWYRSLGIGLLATADALNSGFTTPTEQSAIIAQTMNDTVSVCILSNFNTFFILEALATAGDFDRAVAVIHRCWDVQVLLGGTTVWETSQPDWVNSLSPNDGLPGFEDGYTSMAHPWSSGATPWISKWVLGIRSLEPGFASVVLAPHISKNVISLRGTLPSPKGSIGLSVSANNASEIFIYTYVPAGITNSYIQLSSLLVNRLLSHGYDQSYGTDIQVTYEMFRIDTTMDECIHYNADTPDTYTGTVISAVANLSFAFSSFSQTIGIHYDAPIDPVTRLRVPVHRLALPLHGCVRTKVTLSSSFSALRTVPDPFPPAYYPANFIQKDEFTAGSWIGTYGTAGYTLFAYDGVDKHVTSLPSYINSIVQAFGHAQNGPWPTDGTDVRALQDPRNITGYRKIGQYSVPLPWNNGWDPSYPFDILLEDWAENTVTYQFAVYVVDFDERGRRQTVTLMDRWTLQEISPVQFVSNFEKGVWLVWQYNRSVRLRFNYIRGDNQVVSAIMFDNVTVTGNTLV